MRDAVSRPWWADGLVGRHREVAQVSAALNDGASVLLQGKAGAGVSTVGKAALADRDTDPLRIISGLPPLADTPLGAFVVAGVAPPRRTTDGVSQHVRTTLRAFEVTAQARKAPLMILVEGVGALDTFSASLLTQLVERGWAQLVICSQLGAPLVELRPLLSSGAVHQFTVTPLDDDVLRGLAPQGTDAQLIERALAVADGSPLWFREAINTGWFGDSLPMPATLRELADYHLSRLETDVVRVLEYTVVAGAISPAILTLLTSPEAVQVGLDAELLRLTADLTVMDNLFLRSRVQELTSIRVDRHRSDRRTGPDLNGWCPLRDRCPRHDRPGERHRDRNADGSIQPRTEHQRRRGASAFQTFPAATLKPSISGDGRFVAFVSRAPNLVPDPDASEIFLRVPRLSSGRARAETSVTERAKIVSGIGSLDPGFVTPHPQTE